MNKNVRFGHFHFASQFGLDGDPQQWQRPEPFDS
jgi:hypothetical protein